MTKTASTAYSRNVVIFKAMFKTCGTLVFIVILYILLLIVFTWSHDIGFQKRKPPPVRGDW